MKAILVDDEQLALDFLAYHLSKMPDVEIAGTFSDPITAKEKILQTEVDVVFMDIHMPEISGIELAEQLLESKPRLNIVFVTAYDDYAIKAFELNALDYIMKPIGKDRLERTVERLRNQLNRATVASAPATDGPRPIRMTLFKHVRLEDETGQLAPIRWRTNKAQELFLYLLQHRAQLVRKSVLIELLWPENDPVKAYAQLYTTIYHIRKKLEPYTAYFQLSNAMDGYMLHVENVLMDVEQWQQFQNAGVPLHAGTIGEYEQMEGLFAGEYLEDYDYVWAEQERYRLSESWLRLALQMAEWYGQNGEWEKSEALYGKICTLQPLTEEAHFALMKIYASRHNHVSVHRQYDMLKVLMQEELGIQPSPHISNWYSQWKREHQA